MAGIKLMLPDIILVPRRDAAGLFENLSSLFTYRYHSLSEKELPLPSHHESETRQRHTIIFSKVPCHSQNNKVQGLLNLYFTKE